MECKDPECIGGGSAPAERQAVSVFSRQINGVQIEMIDAVGSPFQLSGVTADVEGKNFKGLTVGFQQLPQPLAMMILTISLMTAEGAVADLVATTDATLTPTLLDPKRPLNINALAEGRSNISKVTVRVDYAHLIGRGSFGLYAERLYRLNVEKKSLLLEKIRRIRSEIGGAPTAGAVEKFLPRTPDFDGFRSVLALQGVLGLMQEMNRAERNLVLFGAT